MKKILLCIFVFMVMFLLITPLSFAGKNILLPDELVRVGLTKPTGDNEPVLEYKPSGGGGPILKNINTNINFGVDYIRYGIYNPGWQLSNISGMNKTMMKNINNGKCANCHMNSSANSVPEPKQRSPDMMKGNTT